MANAVHDTCLPNSQSDADVRPGDSAGPDFEAIFHRVESSQKSLQSAAAIFLNDGRRFLNKIKATNKIKVKATAPRGDETDARLREAAASLDEIGTFVSCALLATMGLENEKDSDTLYATLSRVLARIRKASKDLAPDA